MDHVAVLVAEYLDFDVPRIGDEFLQKNPVVAETRFRFGARSGEIFRDLGFVESDAHTLAAAAGRGFDHHRKTDLLGNGDGLLVVFDHTEMAGNDRDFGARRRFL